MKTKFLIGLVGLFQLASFQAEASGQCNFGKETENQNRSDSAFFQVHNDKVNYQTDEMVTRLKDTESARAYLDEVAHQMKCNTKDWVYLNQSCTELNERTVCVMSVEGIGQFVLSSNWVDHVNVVYNRWD